MVELANFSPIIDLSVSLLIVTLRTNTWVISFGRDCKSNLTNGLGGYKDFINDNGSVYSLDLIISDTFDMSKDTIAIGSKEFVKEMKECLEVDVRGIVEEY